MSIFKSPNVSGIVIMILEPFLFPNIVIFFSFIDRVFPCSFILNFLLTLSASILNISPFFNYHIG